MGLQLWPRAPQVAGPARAHTHSVALDDPSHHHAGALRPHIPGTRSEIANLQPGLSTNRAFLKNRILFLHHVKVKRYTSDLWSWTHGSVQTLPLLLC